MKSINSIIRHNTYLLNENNNKNSDIFLFISTKKDRRKLKMNKCVECGSVSRSDRSYLCQECFDSALKKKLG